MAALSKQLGPFQIGQVKAHMYHGLGAPAIRKLVLKSGTGPAKNRMYSISAIGKAIARLHENPGWEGERREGSGAPRKTTEQLDEAIFKFVCSNRGRKKIVVSTVRKRFPQLKSLSNSLVEERLHEAGLRYMRRRRKTLVPKKYIRDRLDYSRWVMAQRHALLMNIAYSDGTVFYLDKEAPENEHTQRRALGCMVWRQADGTDSLYHDCVGPSAYSKAQGLPIKVWGVLAHGKLSIHVLEEGESMDQWVYAALIEDHFDTWLDGCHLLIQDFEKCLRAPQARAALDDVGVTLVEKYPRCSQDFNGIENAWKLLRDQLDATLPSGLESRSHFVTRLHDAVRFLNRNKGDELWYHCTNQKDRAWSCLYETDGGRTKY